MTNINLGIGFFGLLTLLFIGLKLTGYIDWSWWWVLSPLVLSVISSIFWLIISIILIVIIERFTK